MSAKTMSPMLDLAMGSALVLCLGATAASAGPAEDYAAGNKAYMADDLPTAMSLFERASAAGHAPSQAMLAWILDGAEDNARAVALYRKSAAQGDPDGQYGLATMYIKGEGIARDYAEAVTLLELAARQGHGPAAIALGAAYVDGDLGLDRDPVKGRALIEQAAAAGYAPAQAKLDSLNATAQRGGDGNQ